MTPEEFKREHVRLVKILLKGTKKEQTKEGKKQLKELKEFLRKHKKSKE